MVFVFVCKFDVSVLYIHACVLCHVCRVGGCTFVRAHARVHLYVCVCTLATLNYFILYLQAAAGGR